MTRHTCHLPGCNAACPPAWLFCKPHWRMVPRPLQDKVYATVKQRGMYVDRTWAPWWRAQAEATKAVLDQVRPGDERVQRHYERELEFVEQLEKKESDDD